MLTLTSEYALRALIYLARQQDHGQVSGRSIARETGIPPKYLSSVLRSLVRAGVLQSSRGKGGGFRLARPARDVRLHDVLAPFEPVLSSRRPCPFGHKVCSDEEPCSGHDRWKQVRAAYNHFMDTTTLQDVSSAPRRSPRGRGALRRSR